MMLANGILWRTLRYKTERYTNFITVLPDVTDLISDINKFNNSLKQRNININNLKIITIDMKDMYPMTKKSKILSGLIQAQSYADMPRDSFDFMSKAQEFINKYSYFYVGNKVYNQPDGAIICSYDGGDICDTVYYLDDLNNHSLIQALEYFARYRDDIIIFYNDVDQILSNAYLKQNPNNNIIINLLRKIYGSDILFTINIDPLNKGIAFLDSTLTIDHANTRIATKSYSKPDNAHEYTQECSNIPSHTLKSVIKGQLKRYIIVNDDPRHYHAMRTELYNRVKELGWTWEDIRSIRDKPKYQNRMQYIEDYLNNQTNKKSDFIQNNQIIDLVPYPKTDDDTIITVKPEFEACFDNLSLLTKRIDQARTTCPDRLRRCKHIIANKGVPKVGALFNKNGK